MSASTTFMPSARNRSPSARPIPPPPPVTTATFPPRSCTRSTVTAVSTPETRQTRRYTVISADCHAGADLRDYRPFLEARYLDDFDDWADNYVSPFGDLVKPDADRNWNSTRRMRDLEADGIVAEVIYPNTVPPFFPKGGLTSLAPSPEEFELRLAGLRAHNRWLAAWCAEFPERRAGVGQILLNDLDEAVRDVHWIADNGLRGGVLLPGIPPGRADPADARAALRPGVARVRRARL